MDLSPSQRRFLAFGVRSWVYSGDRPGTPVIAAFPPPVDDVPSWGRRIADTLDRGDELPRADLERALFATELAFASQHLRGGPARLGFPDRDAITLLRDLQLQVHHGLSASVHEAAWTPMRADETDAVWDRFDSRFAFRPSIYDIHWPGITEPTPSVTFDLSGLDDAPAWARTPETPPAAALSARIDALDAMALLAFTEIVPDGARMAVLDWQHRCHWFRPDLQAHRGGPWTQSVCPDGDYYIFLTEDLAAGTFGHPWERTLCVFGEPLMTTLVPLLTGWLPITRDHR
ncbi:DUF2716 domain-containing protein [Actinoplanes oblitus]|uniref:DUF2716 domain-containing protein n=1 Tax=Actinoplanes oblitus TaxID=3040509 RepID=A0ABY8WBP1_9ACTN|nr:DUF2716 domain-containing protein [Actinoplanes oblitus]WIM93883.1 DUF2716 domain-containing protein [Actinoplanes oblitus]